MKKKTGIQSSGLLSFHIGKLAHMIEPTQDGRYALADQGREALRMIQITKSDGSEQTIKVRSAGPGRYRIVIAILLVCLVALGSFSIYQQQRMTTLNHGNAGSPPPYTLVYGTLSHSVPGWASGITVGSEERTITFTSSSWKDYTASVSPQGQYWILLPGNDTYTVSASSVTDLQCATTCQSVFDNMMNSTESPVAANQTVAKCPSSGCAAPRCVPSGCLDEVSLKVEASPNLMRYSLTCGGYILALDTAESSFNMTCG